ncbi:amidohydrolase [Amycolatopsis sp. NPDC024027]|uniref:amidohydrolase n=1 Tax=Amycolatopsis sp. NPDC024027 TaxID=3154327 RepID=UPI003405259B
MTVLAELVVRNAIVHTMVPGAAPAEAFAASGGRLVAVGDDETIGKLIGSGTQVVDLDGAPVVPGLVDAHNHHALAGRAELFEVRFPSTATVAEIVEAVRAWVAAHPDQEWVTGGTWGVGLLDALADPAALKALDAVSAGKKVLLTDDSHHNKWANTAAMAASGIDAPTGVLIEAAGALVQKAFAQATDADPEFWAACSARGVELMNSRGITAFLDAGATEGVLRGLARLDEDHRLNGWAVSAMLVNDFVIGAEKLGAELFAVREQTRTRHHRPDFAKVFLDGIPPTYTAAFLDPYAPSADHGQCFRGATVMDQETLENWLRRADSEGLGVKVHCTGSAAVRQVLDAVEAVRASGVSAIVHVAHGQYVAEEDIPRFAPLDVVAEISPPLWFPCDIVDVMRSILPASWSTRVHPNRSLLDAGARLACGSDWPVAPDPNPWPAIAGLVTRANPYGTHPGTLWPEQAITVCEALDAYTASGAAAVGLADEIGSLAAGRSADFVVLDRDPFAVEPVELAGTEIVQTWFEGRPVFSRSSSKG